MDIETGFFSHPAVQTGLVPLVLGFVLTGGVRFANGSQHGPQVAPAGVGLAFLATYFVIMGVPPIPPVQAVQKLAYAVAGGLVVGFLLDFGKLPAAFRWVLFPIGTAAVLYWIAWRKLQAPDIWMILGAVALWLSTIISMWRLEAGREARLNPSVKLLIAALGMAAVAVVGHTAALAQLAFALAAAIAGYMLWNWPVYRWPYGGALLMGAGAALATIGMIIVLYTRVSVIAMALLLLIFFADIAARRINLGSGGLAKALEPVVLAGLCLVPALAAVAAAHFSSSLGEATPQ